MQNRQLIWPTPFPFEDKIKVTAAFFRYIHIYVWRCRRRCLPQAYLIMGLYEHEASDHIACVLLTVMWFFSSPLIEVCIIGNCYSMCCVDTRAMPLYFASGRYWATILFASDRIVPPLKLIQTVVTWRLVLAASIALGLCKLYWCYWSQSVCVISIFSLYAN